MSHVRPSIADKRRTFHRLHEQGCFVIPNPWDVGSARYLESMGFKALATTSSGFAWSHGHADGGMSRDRVLEHLNNMVEGTNVPINADFESGFAPDAAGVAESVRMAVETGVAGLSIEDSTGQDAAPLYDLDVAVERVRAARKAIDMAGADTLLVARTECFLVGRADMDFAVGRLKAYAGAGADCLYAPGVGSPEHIAALVAAVSPKPVNVLVGFSGDLTLAQFASLGVRRLSVGGALARAAWGGLIRAAKRIKDEGRFDGFTDAASGRELNRLFGAH
jgi:2-methylisocitrate lyase-like PEP mutase family enzyme